MTGGQQERDVVVIAYPDHLQRNGALMASRLGVKLTLRKIAVKAFDEPRPYPIPHSLMTTDWQSVVNDPHVQVVIELVGGLFDPQDEDFFVVDESVLVTSYIHRECLLKKLKQA